MYYYGAGAGSSAGASSRPGLPRRGFEGSVKGSAQGLRAKGVRHLVLSGIATSGVVLSTLREAADKDYRLTVLSDLCADRDPEVHSVLMTKVFPRQAQVTSIADWTASIYRA